MSQLTLEEKVNLTTGTGWELDRCVGQTGSIPRLGFRAMCLQDSPVGVRDTDFNSVFPAGVNVAASFDRGLAYARGRAMGQEHKGKGVDVQLGPVAGPLGRTPEGGRNWEGFSPDQVLTGVMFAESIKGIQSAGVLTSAKHYIAYGKSPLSSSSETSRLMIEFQNKSTSDKSQRLTALVSTSASQTPPTWTTRLCTRSISGRSPMASRQVLLA